MFHLQSAIIPTPFCTKDRGETVTIGYLSESNVCFKASGTGDIFEEAAKYVLSALADQAFDPDTEGNYPITLTVDPADPRFDGKGKKECYLIDISAAGAELVGFDEAGAYYAAVSLRKLIHTESSAVLLPACFILDFPYFDKRGHFMECRYGSDFMTLEDWKQGIDYLADMKTNTVVVGLYGCWSRQYDGAFAEYQYIPFKKYPEIRTPRNIKYYSAKERKWNYQKNVLPVMYETDYFGELVAYGKKKNVEVIPLFNSLGHNTLLPRLYPEISAKDENGNDNCLGFCTSNEKTYELMFDLYDEIIDRYLTPNGVKSFQIGLDEVWPVLGVDEKDLMKPTSPFCKCEKCRDRNYGDLMIEYIIRITKHMQEKGIENVLVYHDMLMYQYDLLNEKTAQLFKDEGVWDTIIIDWWSYSSKEKLYHERANDVNNLFRSIAKPITGYYHWSMPSHNNHNIDAITEVAYKNDFEGMITYSSFEYCYDYNYQYFADCAWNPENADRAQTLEKYAANTFPECANKAAKALRLADEMMGAGALDKNGKWLGLCGYYNSTYLSKDRGSYPQDYPATIFRMMADEEENVLKFLRDLKSIATEVYEFFDNNTASTMGSVWKLSAASYQALADEFLTIYYGAKEYNAGRMSAWEFISELDRLVTNRDKVIALCEDVRIKANQYIAIRNMTVYRQMTCDLRDYLKAELTAGRKPEVDLGNYKKYLSSVSWFLR